jgi:integrase/recombinase XerD
MSLYKATQARYFSLGPDHTYQSRYLQIRRELSRERGWLFLSESYRYYGKPISIWTRSKTIARMAERCNLPRFTPHTLRHPCLTDLARANWDIHEIATFAGHRSLQTTTLYIHLSGARGKA